MLVINLSFDSMNVNYEMVINYFAEWTAVGNNKWFCYHNN